MAEDLSAGTLSVDTGPYQAALDKLLAQTDLLGAAAKSTGAVQTQALAEAARAATAYSDRLAAATAEQRAARDAVASAREALRQLTEQQKELTTAQGKTNSTTAEYQRLTRELEKNKQAIAQVKQAIDESRAAVVQEREAVEQVREARRQEVNATREAAAAAKDAAAAAKQEAAAEKEVAAAAKQAGSASASASKEAGEGTSFFGNLLNKAGSLFAGLFAVGKLKQIGEEIIETTAEFERLAAVLTTINGGDEGKGKTEFAALRQFTLRNPFEVREVTEAYVQLRNRGITPTTQQLQSLADLAAASGKSFDQVTEGLLGATTGQYRRLKEFGVTAKQQGDTVAFTFRGVTTVVEKSQQAIAQYVLGLGELNGVAGATERIMNTTGGRITNLKDSFTELFATIGEGSNGPLNGFIKRLTEAVTALKLARQTTEEKAQSAAAPEIVKYQELIEARYKRIAEAAKASGQDVGQALESASADQVKFLDAGLARAKQKLDAYNRSLAGLNESNLDKIENGLDPLGLGRAQLAAIGVTKKVSPREELQKEIDAYEGKKKAAQEAAAAVSRGALDEADALGLVEKQRKKIEALVERQKNALREDKGNGEDYLLGKGGLDEQLKEANKELDRLLGKEEKLRKARQYSYESQLRALLQERETLTSLAAKAGEQMADDATARARAVFEESLRQVDVVKSKLEQRENDLRKAAAKVGGGAVRRLGDKADGVVDGVQDAELAKLRVAALDKYYEELGKIELAREQRLFDLRAASDEKEVEAVDRKYDALIKAAKDGIERQAIEEARAREQLRVQFEQQTKQAATAASLATARATAAGATYGTDTGISVIDAKRAEKRALLEIELKHQKDILNASLLLNTEQGEIARAGAEAQLAIIRKSIQDGEREKASHRAEDSLFKLLLGEEDSDENRAKVKEVVGEAIQAIDTILQAEAQAAQARIDLANQNIASLQSSLAAEIQLNREGAASNIAGIQQNIAEEKAARREAIAEKKRIQKEEAFLNGLQQASAIATAAANLILGWSTLPLVGQVLGAISVAAMLASFLAARATANNAAQSSYFLGGYTGDGDPTQPSQAQGPRPYEYHRREFIMNHGLTDTYRHSLFEPLHKGRPQDIDWAHPSLAALRPDLSLPGVLRQEKADFMRVQHEHSFAPMKQELNGLRAELAEIKETNAQMAARWDSHRTPEGVLLVDPATGSTHEIKTG